MNLKMGFDWSLRRLTLKAKRAGVAVDFKSVIHATRSLNVCHRNLDSFGFFFETNAVSMVSVNLEGLVSGMLSMSDCCGTGEEGALDWSLLSGSDSDPDPSSSSSSSWRFP